MKYRHDSRLPELLSPAGNLDSLRAAVRFGADAVYLGAKNYGLRAFSDNFTYQQLAASIAYAHGEGVKVYITLNIFAYEDDLDGLLAAAKTCRECGADAAIVSDPGVLQMLRESLPDWEFHLSTQANTTNSRTARFFIDNGASRIILARELSLQRIAAMRGAQPDVQLEAFVHGSMCASMSGRCVLSNHLTGRDSNQGACAQPCRWKYALVEEKRPGQYMPVGEDERGFYVYSANDLCMIQHLDKLCQLGLKSLKIEGRMKTDFYVATVTRAYRAELDRWAASPGDWQPDPEAFAEVGRAGHRPFCTGFYFGHPDDPPGSVGTVQTADYIARVLSYNNGMAMVEQRNRFAMGDQLTLLTPSGLREITITSLFSEEGTPIEAAPHPRMKVLLPVPIPVEEGDLLRREKAEGAL